MKVLLIIPAYNEGESLPRLLHELAAYPEYDVLVVDDCSKDNTREIAAEFGVKCVSLPINLGLSGAVQTGLLYGVQSGADVCVQVDGDGQHIPSEIIKLLAVIEQGADIAIGSRFLDKEHAYKQSFSRSLGAKHIAFFVRMLSGLRLTDPTSGMRAFNRAVFTRMAVATNERPEPDTMLFYARKGYVIREVHVTMRERISGTSYLTFWKSIRYMIEHTLSFLFITLKTKRVKEGETCR